MSEHVIRGTLERVTYASRDSGYVVYKLSVEGEDDVVAAVGFTQPNMPGEELELVGDWTVHPKFGRQFKFTSCRSLVPSSTEGIKRYLSSGMIRGIGPKTAERIVDAFGAETLDVMDERPDELLSIKGISTKLLASIKEAWAEQREVRGVMLFLESNGVSSGFAHKIFSEYGSDTIQVVRENPYRLADDIFGVGFLTADKIAAAMGMEKGSPQRVQAGVRYAMNELSDEGHVCAPRDELIKRSAELLEISQEAAGQGVAAAIAAGTLISERTSSMIYAPIYYTAETKSASMLAELASDDPIGRLLESVGSMAPLERSDIALWARQTMEIDLAAEQLDALALAARSKVMVVTGGPGTGKTTIIRAMIGIWGERGLRVSLAAPTGRAAKRMSEATGREAKTIHRLLEYSGDGMGFGRGPDAPLDCDLLVVDEASMIDAVLFWHLLRAIPSECRLILVGDIHQLPSVGPGNVLGDIIASGVIPTAELKEIFRQAQTSSIIVNAHKVNAGLLPEDVRGQGLRDFYMIEQEDPAKCIDMILQMVGSRIKEAFGLDPMNDVQVLTPMRRGELGTGNLNSVLQSALNPGDVPAITRGGRKYKVGDRVMQTKNDYDKEIYNGDIGRITMVDAANGLLWIDVDGREIAYQAEELDDLTLAYAVSIHKSQGSEYPCVIIPIHMQHYVLLQRNLLYTAITRGKELVILIGTKRALTIAVKNDDTKKRWTRFAERLKNEIDNINKY